jgi:hypothetical protein
MEMIRGWWYSFANAVGAFLDEAKFRTLLCLNVALGRIPTETKHRRWNPEMERPAVLHVRDWVTGRHILSVVVWPPLESKSHDAFFAMDRRVEQAKAVIAEGCASMAWSTAFEVEYGLTWDPARKVWTDSSGFSYECPKREAS